MILVVGLFSIQIPEVNAPPTIGSHVITAEYYRAHIYDDHDGFPLGDGEWYFRLTQPSGAYQATGERKVGDHENEFFSLELSWQIGGNQYFRCRAQEKDDPLGWDDDSLSVITVDVPFPGPGVDLPVEDHRRKGDVDHYYSYSITNNRPTLGSLSIPSAKYRGSLMTFSVSAIDADGDSVTFEWKMDGVIQSSTTSSMTYTFPMDAPLSGHKVSVRAKDAVGGYSNLKEYSFDLTNQKPTLNAISGPSTVYRGDTVTFHVAGSDPESDYPLTFAWTIDGYDMGVAGPTLAFVHMSDPSSVGDHVVAVTATDQLGAVSAARTKDFETLNHAPTVSAISGPTSGYRGTYTWTATGSDTEGDPLTYSWYVDGTYKSGGSSFTYTFGSSDTIGSHTIKVRVKDVVGDYSSYSTLTFILNAPGEVAAPTFAPAAGTYSSSQSVTISCSTSGATIRYTLDGSEPTSSSATCADPIAVETGTVTIKAKAFKSGMTDSATATATYTIVAPDGVPIWIVGIVVLAIAIATVAILLSVRKK
ncbi:MAG: chitobiase/beta-hexosaminidase C-terminal domain-containing protein [Candidatus Bathyarchaeota archaeon]|nr:chitobiase/beta-hexosaminidase C-terminal domain-containing protein [Candidatus Bathyarchaeota archaeon]